MAMSSSSGFEQWVYGIGRSHHGRHGKTDTRRGSSVRSDGIVLTMLLCSANGICAICSILIKDTTTMSHTAYLSMSLIQKGWAADILVPWGATGVCERARRGSWFLRVRGSRV